ncbi:MAG: HAD-IA family hydrolase [Candidatus Aenigmarchaeota archaeon]|nr:HAD-IA family hydrolase [Candidatus Aenigmarchaeota archaeon]
MIKAVLFDLDNTLVDFMRMKTISCEAAIDAMIKAGLDMEKKKAMDTLFYLYDKKGLEYQKIFQLFLRHVTGKVDYGIMACGIVAYRRVKDGLIYPYKNVIPTLNKIKKKRKIIILSNAPRIQAWLRLAAMGMHDMFEHVITFDDTKVRKPGKEPFLYALKKLKLKPEECLMVGDSLGGDILPAKKMGFKTAYAKYGFDPTMCEVSKVKADYVLEDIKDLLKILE